MVSRNARRNRRWAEHYRRRETGNDLKPAAIVANITVELDRIDGHTLIVSAHLISPAARLAVEVKVGMPSVTALV